MHLKEVLRHPEGVCRGRGNKKVPPIYLGSSHISILRMSAPSISKRIAVRIR